MCDTLFMRKTERRFPAILYELALDLFSVVQYWKSPVCGAARGRLFEKILYRHCEKQQYPMTETAGSRTIRGVRAASGLMHENDAVIACPDLTIHCELKHLTDDVSKNDVLIFNQKGIDFLCAENRLLRRLPLHRVFLSGSLLSPAARRFASNGESSSLNPTGCHLSSSTVCQAMHSTIFSMCRLRSRIKCGKRFRI